MNLHKLLFIHKKAHKFVKEHKLGITEPNLKFGSRTFAKNAQVREESAKKISDENFFRPTSLLKSTNLNYRK